MNAKLYAALTVSVFLAGCSTKPSDLEAKTEPVVRTYAENYQEIYRRLATTARRCLAGNVSAYASFDVDAELYPDLGFGEISQSLVNAGIRNYYWTAKVEHTDTGSKLTMNAGNTLSAGSTIRKALRWADGDDNC